MTQLLTCISPQADRHERSHDSTVYLSPFDGSIITESISELQKAAIVMFCVDARVKLVCVNECA
jgi:hypothetical protein